jgi:hypothetical protein
MSNEYQRNEAQAFMDFEIENKNRSVRDAFSAGWMCGQEYLNKSGIMVSPTSPLADIRIFLESCDEHTLSGTRMLDKAMKSLCIMEMEEAHTNHKKWLRIRSRRDR